MARAPKMGDLAQSAKLMARAAKMGDLAQSVKLAVRRMLREICSRREIENIFLIN